MLKLGSAYSCSEHQSYCGRSLWFCCLLSIIVLWSISWPCETLWCFPCLSLNWDSLLLQSVRKPLCCDHGSLAGGLWLGTELIPHWHLTGQATSSKRLHQVGQVSMKSSLHEEASITRVQYLKDIAGSWDFVCWGYSACLGLISRLALR